MKCGVCKQDIVRGRLLKASDLVRTSQNGSKLVYDLIECPYCKSQYHLLSNQADYLVVNKTRNFEQDRKIAERMWYAEREGVSITDVNIPNEPVYLDIITSDELTLIVYLNNSYEEKLRYNVWQPID